MSANPNLDRHPYETAAKRFGPIDKIKPTLSFFDVYELFKQLGGS
jgi:hypothetical protein